MTLFGIKFGPPSVLTADRYALAQVALYIFALASGVTAGFQLVAALATPAAQIPAGGSRLLMYAIPAIQNAFWTAGIVYLSYKLQSDINEIVWRLCVGVMLLQIIASALQLLAQVNLLPLIAFALAIFGLGSLLVGKESSVLREVGTDYEQDE